MFVAAFLEFYLTVSLYGIVFVCFEQMIQQQITVCKGIGVLFGIFGIDI